MGGQRKRNAPSFPTFRDRKVSARAVQVFTSVSGGREQRAGGTLPGRVQAKAFKQQGSEAGLLLQLALQRVDLLGQRDIL
jgi:hypothetical protein